MFFVTEASAEETTTTTEAATPAGVTVHTETGVAQDGAHSGVFPPFDTTSFASQLLWLALTFGLFYILLSRVIVPRIGGILENRSGRIIRDLAEAAKMKEEADAAVAAYEQELTAARANAAKIGNEARDAAKADAEAQTKSNESALAKKVAEAETRIAAVRAAGMSQVETIAENTTAAILGKLTGAKFTPSQISAAVKAARE